MGCCNSCLGNGEDENDETRPFLPKEGTGVSINDTTEPILSAYDYDDMTPPGSLPKIKHDEQSILSGIITQYNNDVIDITALESKIDAVEYMNRVQQYNRKVSTLTSGTRYKQPSLHSSGSNPASILNAPSISINDVYLITEVSNGLQSAMNNVKIAKTDELVLSLNHR
uniref:Ragulator complex protein LAMTOR1 n=1 Tax=Phallusia mammillata TaxID=59560 RepID=A0A6F9DI76_9ASCI|nr:uncharacterized protein LOC100181499 [Phallusia mammillata]